MTKRRDFLVGIVFLSAIIGVGYMTIVIKGLSYLTGHKYPLRVSFEEILGLEEGEEVLAKGVKIGQVAGIQYVSDGRVAVDLVLFDDPRLHQDHAFEIRAKSPLGGKYVAITPGTEGDYIPPEDYERHAFTGRRPSDVFQKIAEILGRKQDAIETLIDDVATAASALRDENGGPIGAFLHSQKLREEIVQAVSDLAASVIRDTPEERQGLVHAVLHDRALAGDVRTVIVDLRGALTDSKTPIGLLLNDTAAGADVKETLSVLAEKARDLREGKGTIGRLFSEDTLYTNAVGAFDSIGQITEGPGALPWLIADKESRDVGRKLLKDLGDVAGDLNSDESTIGRLVRNPEIYDNAYKLLVEIRESVEDARENAPINQLVNLLGAVY